MALPRTMKAINLKKTGSPQYNTTAEVTDLKLNSAQPVPVPSSEDVLTRVHAVAITPYELTWPVPTTFTGPRVPCHDISGTVISAPSTSSFRPGDKVFGLLDFMSQGGMAEYTLANPAHLAKISEGLDFVAAASVSRAALTSYQALKDVKEGSSVLITGASGAVGRMGVQIAKRKVGEKGKVVAVGGKGSERLKELGADVVVNYREVEDWVVEVRKQGLVDVLYDCVGEKTLEKSLELVRDGGRIVTVASPPPEYANVAGWDELKGRSVDGGFLMVSESGEDLVEIGELIKDGALKTSVSFVVDGLSEDGVQDGWRRALKGGIGGSVVVKVL